MDISRHEEYENIKFDSLADVNFLLLKVAQEKAILSRRVEELESALRSIQSDVGYLMDLELYE